MCVGRVRAVNEDRDQRGGDDDEDRGEYYTITTIQL